MTQDLNNEQPDFEFWEGLVSVRSGVRAMVSSIFNRKKFTQVAFLVSLVCATAMGVAVGTRSKDLGIWPCVLIFSIALLVVGSALIIHEREKSDGTTTETDADEQAQP